MGGLRRTTGTAGTASPSMLTCDCSGLDDTVIAVLTPGGVSVPGAPSRSADKFADDDMGGGGATQDLRAGRSATCS